jgi:hypothetical protein
VHTLLACGASSWQLSLCGVPPSGWLQLWAPTVAEPCNQLMLFQRAILRPMNTQCAGQTIKATSDVTQTLTTCCGAIGGCCSICSTTIALLTGHRPIAREVAIRTDCTQAAAKTAEVQHHTLLVKAISVFPARHKCTRFDRCFSRLSMPGFVRHCLAVRRSRLQRLHSGAHWQHFSSGPHTCAYIDLGCPIYKCRLDAGCGCAFITRCTRAGASS